MIANPEFRRNLWLEWSTHRMALVGGLVAGIFILAKLFGTSNVVANIALVVFLLTTVLWGGHRAGDSILDELREKTWDSQRMSAIAPWSMTWGKLCGACVMPWFAGTISLSVYFLERQGPNVSERLQVVVFCIAGAVLFHALSLIGALVGTHDKFGKSTLTSWAAVGALGLLAVYFANYLRSDDILVWYGSPYERFNFLTASLLGLGAWITFGAYRLMCMELAVATKPWAWISFLLYLVVYSSGTIISPMWPVSRSLSIFVALGLGICGLASYVAAFSLYRDPLTFRRLGVYAKVGNWRRFCEEVPLWMVSMSMAGLFVIGCLALSLTPHYSQAWVEQLGFSAVVLWLLPMRDILILYYFTYGDSNRRVETSTIICLALLYWLMPSIIESMGLVKTSWMFRPPMEERPILSAIIISLHVLIASALCYRRYRSRIAPALN